MKNIFALLFLLMTAFGWSRGIPVGEEEVLEEVADLPKTADYQMEDGSYLDLAVKYKRMVFGGPLWVTEEPVLVGRTNLRPEVYYDLPPEDLQAIAKENHLNLNELKKIGFFDRYAGWVYLLIAMVIGFAWRTFVKKDPMPDIIHNEKPNHPEKP